MRYTGITKVMIPWFDSTGQKNWSVLKFSGDVDRRRIYREIRKFAKYNFNITVSKEWIKRVPMIVPYSEDTIGGLNASINVDQFVEDFIQRIQYEEDNEITDTDDQSKTTGSTGR